MYKARKPKITFLYEDEARQRSHTVAVAIETFNIQPQGGLILNYTAEFCHQIGNLFDSLNSSQFHNSGGKNIDLHCLTTRPIQNFGRICCPKLIIEKFFVMGSLFFTIGGCS